MGSDTRWFIFNTADVAAGMLRVNGAYAFSSFNGFPPQELPDYGFDTYL